MDTYIHKFTNLLTHSTLSSTYVISECLMAAPPVCWVFILVTKTIKFNKNFLRKQRIEKKNYNNPHANLFSPRERNNELPLQLNL